MGTPKVPPDPKTFEDMIGRLNRIGGEPRGTVLITHLYVEYLLDWILRRKIRNPNKILKRTFLAKLELIESFDIIFPNLMHDLWIVNEIRNLFAHNIDIESPAFENDFQTSLNKMEYYKNNPRYEGISPYSVYHRVMMQIYVLLKNRLDSLNPES